MNLNTVEIKAFVPSSDLAVSVAFYRTLGFEIVWANDAMAYVRHGSGSFLLQHFYVPEHARNFMMHMQVENVDDWHRHVLACGVIAKFATQVGQPEDRPWGIRDFTLVDPSSVLWRVGEQLPRT